MSCVSGNSARVKAPIHNPNGDTLVFCYYLTQTPGEYDLVLREFNVIPNHPLLLLDTKATAIVKGAVSYLEFAQPQLLDTPPPSVSPTQAPDPHAARTPAPPAALLGQ